MTFLGQRFELLSSMQRKMLRFGRQCYTLLACQTPMRCRINPMLGSVMSTGREILAICISTILARRSRKQ